MSSKLPSNQDSVTVLANNSTESIKNLKQFELKPCNDYNTSISGNSSVDYGHCHKENDQNFDPLGLTNPEKYIVGVDALRINNLIIRYAREQLGHTNYHDWRVIDGTVIGSREKKVFLKGTIDSNGNWEGRLTELKRGSRKPVGITLSDADIRAFSEKNGGNGVWYFPQGLYQLPKNEGWKPTNVLAVEWDTLEEDPRQWFWVYVLNEISKLGFTPNFIVSSGNKCEGLAPHAHWIFSKTLDKNLLLFLQRLFAELGADPLVSQKIANQFRLAGFYRASKGKEQGIFKDYYETPYDVKEFLNAIYQVGKNLGIKLTSLEEYIDETNAKENATNNYQSIDLSTFQGTDIEKLLIEIDSLFPSYINGNGTYPYRLKIASAAKALVGTDRAKELGKNLFTGASIGWNSDFPCSSPLGFIVNNVRKFLQDPDWNLPQWWRDKQ